MDVEAIRRMWTFRLFVWGMRCLLVAFLLIVPAYLLPRWFGLPALVLAGAGVALGIPLRVLAFWRLDVPYMALFVLGLNDALPRFMRSKPAAFPNPAGLQPNRRTGMLVPAAPPTPAQRPTPAQAPTPPQALSPPKGPSPAQRPAAGDRESKLADVRASGDYRLTVWGYRLMLLSTVGCCGGLLADDPDATWKVLVPVAGILGGFLLTVPLRFDSQLKLWLSPGRILAQALRDMFNPTFL